MEWIMLGRALKRWGLEDQARFDLLLTDAALLRGPSDGMGR
jgi:hypothetical protein